MVLENSLASCFPYKIVILPGCLELKIDPRLTTNQNCKPHGGCTNTESGPYRNPKCQLCLHKHSGKVTGQSNMSYNIKDSFAHSSSNVIYTITYKQYSPTLCIGQPGQSNPKKVTNLQQRNFKRAPQHVTNHHYFSLPF